MSRTIQNAFTAYRRVAHNAHNNSFTAGWEACLNQLGATPPTGWEPFGTHINNPDVTLEFFPASETTDGDLPLWERAATTRRGPAAAHGWQEATAYLAALRAHIGAGHDLPAEDAQRLLNALADLSEFLTRQDELTAEQVAQDEHDTYWQGANDARSFVTGFARVTLAGAILRTDS